MPTKKSESVCSDHKRTKLSPEEYQRRKEAVDYARASMMLEGFEVDNAEKRRLQDYISGKIDIDELIKSE